MALLLRRRRRADRAHRLNGQISLGHGALMAVGAYATVQIQEADSWPLAVVLLAALGRHRRGRGPGRARPPPGCAVPTWPAPRSRWRSGCRRSPPSSRASSGGPTASPSRPPVPPRVARRDLPARALAGVDRVPALRSSPSCCWPTSCAAASGGASAPSATTRSPRSWRAFTWRAPRSRPFVVSAACAGLAGGLLVVVTSLAAPGAFPLSLSVALLTGVILGGAGQPGGRGLGCRGARARPHLGRRRQQGAVAVGQRPGRTSRSAIYGVVLIGVMLVAPGGSRARSAAPACCCTASGTTIPWPCAAGGGEEVMRSTTAAARGSVHGDTGRRACGSNDDSGGWRLRRVERQADAHRRPASPRPRSPSEATSRSPAPRRPATARSRRRSTPTSSTSTPTAASTDAS